MIVLEVNEINQRIGQAKNNLNATKGQADGLIGEAQTRFIAQIITIIDALIADNVKLTGEIAELKKEPKPDKKK